MHDLGAIEGIGPLHARELASAGISTSGDLLERTATAEQRRDLAAGLRVSARTIDEWRCQADLMRIDGLAPEQAELLAAAGVDGVGALADASPMRLAATLLSANSLEHLVRSAPPEAAVAEWVQRARALRVAGSA